MAVYRLIIIITQYFHTNGIWENYCSAVFAQAQNRRCSKINKNGQTNRCIYATVRIQYRVIIVKAKRLLAKKGIFILLYVFAIDSKKHGHSVRDITRRFLKSIFDV